jgi:cilia- and flagella-associated protein 52
MLVIWDV